MSAALQVIKKFRVQEFKDLQKHIIRFGPFPPRKSGNVPSTAPRLPNPFVPWKHPKTDTWFESKYSLRRQAELVKKAKAAGLLHLLPPGPKNTIPTSYPEAPVSSSSQVEESTSLEQSSSPTVQDSPSSALQELWAMRVVWEGSPEYKAVPGAALGTRLYAGKKRMFKGHKWERVKPRREAHKQMLLRDMNRRVRNYKNVCSAHGFLDFCTDMSTVSQTRETTSSQTTTLNQGAQVAVLELALVVRVPYPVINVLSPLQF